MTDVKDKKSRVLYLDVDDTLLVFSKDYAGFGAPMSGEFIKWALEHFEVRWLTAWCPSGRMREDGIQSGAKSLAYRLNYSVPSEVLMEIKNPKSWWKNKTEGIDFNDPRPWVWVEDEISREEKEILRSKGLFENWYPTYVSRDCRALQVTWKKIAERFNLPCPCEHPWSTKMDLPIILPPEMQEYNVMMERLERAHKASQEKNESSIN